MGEYLPSEVARLVLSYLLENDYSETQSTFMTDCSAIAELKSLSSDRLEYATRVDNRNLTEVLKEYKSLSREIEIFAREVASDKFASLRFQSPVFIVNSLSKIWKSRDRSSSSNKMNVSTAESSTQTHSTPTATSSSQTNLNLKNLTLPLPKVLQESETQTEALLNKDQNDTNNDLPSTTEEDISPIRILSRSDKSDKSSPYFHHNIRVVKNLPRGLVPILPKPVSKVNDNKKISSKVVKTQNSPPEITDITETPGTENNFQERLKRNEVVHSTPSQLRERDRKGKPKRLQQSDDDFLNELLGGVGNKIAGIIPKDVKDKNISDLVDKHLDNDEFFEDLCKVVGAFDPEAESDDSRVNTPVTSPLPDNDSGENRMEVDQSVEELHHNEENIVNDEDANNVSKGFDASLTITTIEEEPEEEKKDEVNHLDPLAQIVRDTINTVTEPYNNDPKPVQGKSPKKVVTRRGRKPVPRKRPGRKVSAPGVTLSVATDQRQKMLGGLSQMKGLLKQAQGFSGSNDSVKIVQTEENASESNGLWAKFLLCNESLGAEDKVKKTDDENNENFQTVDVQILPENIIHDPNVLVEVIDEGSEGNQKGKTKRQRCKKCPACQTPNCGICPECKDKIKFGGRGKLKKGCRNKETCERMKVKPVSNLEKVLNEINLENNIPIVEIENNIIKTKTPSKAYSKSPPKSLSKNQPFHVRKLGFTNSPPAEAPKVKQGTKLLPAATSSTAKSAKTLSPQKDSSPIKRTNSSWNSDVNKMFTAVNNDLALPDQNVRTDVTPQNKQDDGMKDQQSINPYLVRKDMSELNNPTTLQLSYPTLAASSAQPSSVSTLPKSVPPSSLPLSNPSSTTSKPNLVPIDGSLIPANLRVPIPAGHKDGGILIDSNIVFNQQPTPIPVQTVVGVKDKKTSPSQSKKTKPKLQAWDEKLRASLGSAEKDMSHLKHRLSEKERKSKRRSPKKLQPESEDDKDEDDDIELGSVINFQDTDVNPEAQKILDTFANKLLEQIEEKVAENVLQIHPKHSGEKGKASKDKDNKDCKDCIGCKLENMVKSRKSVERLEKPTNLETEKNEDNLEEIAKEIDAAIPDDINVTPDRGELLKDSVKTKEISPTAILKTPKKKDDFVFKTPIKTVGGALTTPIKGITPVKGITPLESKTEPSLTTPQKSLLLSPKTPVSRHIPASPVIFSPVSYSRVVPLTPGSGGRRTRHQSSLHTPTNGQEDMVTGYNSPVTPDSKHSPAPSYYTPSPRSDYSVPSPSHTPGLKFLQEEGDRLSQSDDSCSSTPSPAKARLAGAQKRKTFRNLFKKTTSEAAGKELGSLLEQKILKYPFESGDTKITDKHPLLANMGYKSPAVEPFMSPAGGGGSYDYTSSPQIAMNGPSPGHQPEPAPGQDTTLSRHSSFVSPNRTCYLSPTGVALTSTVLGFHQSPVNTTDSENNDDDLNLELDSTDDEEENENKKITLSQTSAAATVALESATDAAVADTEESVEAIKAHMSSTMAISVHNLSDESNTLSNHIKQTAPAAHSVSPVFNSSIEKIDAPNLSDDSDNEAEVTTSEVDSSTERKAEKLGSFVESYLTVETKESKSTMSDLNAFTPRKPRRISLISTKRKSPIKNGSTKFESRHDANNLDKNLSAGASQLLDQNLGAEASIDLGLGGDGTEEQTMVKEGNNDRKELETRKSPRKHKRKHSASPKAPAKLKDLMDSPVKKRQKLPEKTDNLEDEELKLCFSPEKKPSVIGTDSRPKTPTICKALGLQRSENSPISVETNDMILLNIDPTVPDISGPVNLQKSKDKSKEGERNQSTQEVNDSNKSANVRQTREEKKRKSDHEIKVSSPTKSRRNTKKDPTEISVKSKASEVNKFKTKVSSPVKSQKQPSYSSERSKDKTKESKSVERIKEDRNLKLKPKETAEMKRKSDLNIKLPAPAKRKSKIDPLKSESIMKSTPKELQVNLINIDKLESPVKKNNKISTKSKSSSLEAKEKNPETKNLLNIEELASKSAEILSSLSKISSPQQVASGLNSEDQKKQETFGLQKTDFFVFQNKLPFGVFEEDLK